MERNPLLENQYVRIVDPFEIQPSSPVISDKSLHNYAKKESDEIRNKLKMSNLDGKLINIIDESALNRAQYISQSESRQLDQKLKTSEYYSDKTHSDPIPELVAPSAPNLNKTDAEPSSFYTFKPYEIPDYTSVYDKPTTNNTNTSSAPAAPNTGYQCKEYKSIYD